MSGYLSKHALAILDHADTGPYGSCMFASRSDETLAASLEHQGFLVKVLPRPITFRTTDKGKRRLSKEQALAS